MSETQPTEQDLNAANGAARLTAFDAACRIAGPYAAGLLQVNGGQPLTDLQLSQVVSQSFHITALLAEVVAKAASEA